MGAGFSAAGAVWCNCGRGQRSGLSRKQRKQIRRRKVKNKKREKKKTDEQWSVRADGTWSRPAVMAAWDGHQLWQYDSRSPHHSSPHMMTMTVLHVHLSICLSVSVAAFPHSAASLKRKALCNHPTCCWGSVVVVVSLLMICYVIQSAQNKTFTYPLWAWTVVIITLLLFSYSIIRVFALIKAKSSQLHHGVSVTDKTFGAEWVTYKKGRWTGKPQSALCVSVHKGRCLNVGL